MSAFSKVTQKFQATIPQAIRNILGIKQGDTVSFEIINGQVILRKATPLDIEFTKALEGTLTEWTTDADEEAYNDL